MKKRVPLYGLLGFLLIVAAFLSWWLPHTKPLASFIVQNFFMVGYILFFDALNFFLQGNSLLHHLKRHLKIIGHIFLFTFIIGVIFDVYGLWLAKIWIYPGFPLPNLFFFWPFWGLVGLIVYESYFFLKTILSRAFRHLKTHRLSQKKEKLFFYFIGFIGAIGGTLSITLLLTDWKSPVSAWILFLSGISGWFLLEFAEYELKENSLLKDILGGNLVPLAAIIIGSAITSLIWEILNVPLQDWTYVNWPFAHSNLFGVPLAVFLTWPFVYILFLSFYRVFFKKEAKGIWG